MKRNNYEVQILVNGNPVKEYFHEGKVFIKGEKGSKYSIKIKNNGLKRIVAIPTVDGISAITGNPGDLNDSGYVIEGYDSVTIDGWRVTDNEVATFFFSSKNSSYVSRVNADKGNVGVIGVAIYRERDIYYSKRELINNFPLNEPAKPFNPYYPSSEPMLWDNHSSTCRGSSVMCSAAGFNVQDSNMKIKQDIGTGFGEYKKSNVTNVDFERDPSSLVTFEIYYNTRKELERMGVNFEEKPKYITPSAFPNQYCKPPKDIKYPNR